MVDTKGFETILNETVAEIESKANKLGVVPELVSGFAELDDLTNGFHKGELTLIQGQPAAGKTSFALKMAAKVTRQENATVAVFELEMDARAVGQRFLAVEERINLEHLRTGQLVGSEWERLKWAKKGLIEHKILLDDTPKQTVQSIRAKMKQYKNEEGLVDLVIVDYLQLLEATKHNGRQQSSSDILHELKKIARDYNTSVVVLSQIVSTTEIGNLRQGRSGDRTIDIFEQNADVNLVLYQDQKRVTRGGFVYLEIVITKNSAGPTGIASVYY